MKKDLHSNSPPVTKDGVSRTPDVLIHITRLIFLGQFKYCCARSRIALTIFALGVASVSLYRPFITGREINILEPALNSVESLHLFECLNATWFFVLYIWCSVPHKRGPEHGTREAVNDYYDKEFVYFYILWPLNFDKWSHPSLTHTLNLHYDDWGLNRRRYAVLSWCWAVECGVQKYLCLWLKWYEWKMKCFAFFIRISFSYDTRHEPGLDTRSGIQWKIVQSSLKSLYEGVEEEVTIGVELLLNNDRWGRWT